MIVSLWTYISGCPASVPGPCDKDIRQPADFDQGTGLHRLPQGRLAGCKAWGRGAGRGSSFACGTTAGSGSPRVASGGRGPPLISGPGLGRTGPGDTRPRGELGWAKASASADRSPGSSAGWPAAWARSWSRLADRRTACGRSAQLAALTASVGCLL